MKAQANLFRPLLVVPVVALVAVALFGLGLRTAESQTTPSYYKVEALYMGFNGEGSYTYTQTSGINGFGHVVGGRILVVGGKVKTWPSSTRRV